MKAPPKPGRASRRLRIKVCSTEKSDNQIRKANLSGETQGAINTTNTVDLVGILHYHLNFFMLPLLCEASAVFLPLCADFLCIDHLHRATSDVVHPLQPFHLIFFLETLGKTLLLCHLGRLDATCSSIPARYSSRLPERTRLKQKHGRCSLMYRLCRCKQVHGCKLEHLLLILHKALFYDISELILYGTGISIGYVKNSYRPLWTPSYGVFLIMAFDTFISLS